MKNLSKDDLAEVLPFESRSDPQPDHGPADDPAAVAPGPAGPARPGRGKPRARTAAAKPRSRAATKRAALRRRLVPLPDGFPEDGDEDAPPAPATLVDPVHETRPARLRPRHWFLLISFVAAVLLPVVAATIYLQTLAAPQYHSDMAFSIRSSEAGSSAAAGLLGALTQIGTSTGSDADVLNEYISSQQMVENIDKKLDLRRMFNRVPSDFWFSLGKDPSIESLVRYWNRMVDVDLEGRSGIIHVTVSAFDPQDARAIAQEIVTESSVLVNTLSDAARADAIRFATEEQALAEANLRKVRQRMSDFRRANRIVDPTTDVAGQAGLVNALQSQLAQALVSRDELLSFADESDQRVIQAGRRIDAIKARIEEERNSLEASGSDGAALPDVIGAYQDLQIDQDFANTAYSQTLAGLAGARAAAEKQSRYLALHIQPTLAETTPYPRAWLISGLLALFLSLGWGVVMLIYYNVRDNS